MMTSSVRATSLPMLVPLVSLLMLAGCSNDDVGVPCQLPGAGTGTGTGTGTSGGLRPVVVTNALDCLSRLCVRPGTTDTTAKPLCTKICSSDDDCPGPGDESCKTPGNQPERYVCQEIQETGTLKCCKMCICKTYSSGSSEVSATCATVKANCPGL